MNKDRKTGAVMLNSYLSGIITSVIITIAVFLVYAAVMTVTGGTEEKNILYAVYITSLAAVFAGSITAARKLKENGLVSGVVIGILYVFLMLLTGFIAVPEFSISIKTAVTLGISVLSGAVGGALGVNMKS